MRSRRAIPPRLLEEPPEVNLGLALYMKAFWDLCADRLAQGGRIPWTAIHSWCRANEIDAEEEYDFHFLVGRIDIAYLQWVNKKSAKPEKQTPEKSNGKPQRVRS